MAKRTSDQIYVATRTAHIEFEGRRQIIRKNVTRVAAGHPLLKQHPNLFKPAGDDVRFDVEDAQARPATRDKATSRAAHVSGGKDDATDTPKPYSSWKASQLKDEIALRNATRGPDDQLTPAGRRNADLAQALEADDAEQAAQRDSDDPPTGGEPSDDPPTGGEPSDDPPTGGSEGQGENGADDDS